MVDRSPTQGSTTVAPSGALSVTFSEPVNGIDGNNFRLYRSNDNVQLSAIVSYDAATRTATLRPSSPLASSTAYYADIGVQNRIADAADNTLIGSEWSFTTADATRPAVTGRAPASGATFVARSYRPAVAFSESVRNVGPATFTLRRADSGALVAGSVINTSSTRAEFRPSAALRSPAVGDARLSGNAPERRR